jgi:hypothetical protein
MAAREPLAVMIRPGNTGSNTAADHVVVIDGSVAAADYLQARGMSYSVGPGRGEPNGAKRHSGDYRGEATLRGAPKLTLQHVFRRIEQALQWTCAGTGHTGAAMRERGA